MPSRLQFEDVMATTLKQDELTPAPANPLGRWAGCEAILTKVILMW